jgi:hypothetical protein
LHFEVASYHDRLAKHWPAQEERLAVPDFQAQLWAAGQLASADAALQLLHGRAARSHHEKESATAPAPWPEFSEYSCLSCHQRLQPVDENQTLRLSQNRSIAAGQPEWNPWFLVLPLQKASTDESDSLPASFAAWGTLRTRMKPLLATNAQDIEGSTDSVRRQLFTDFGYLANAGLRYSPPVFSQNDLVQAIRAAAPRAESWESLCQVFLALQAADREYQDTLRRTAPHMTAGLSIKLVIPAAMTEWRRNLESIRWSLAYSKGTDVPRALLLGLNADDLPNDDVLPPAFQPMTLDKIRDLAIRLAEQLAGRD